MPDIFLALDLLSENMSMFFLPNLVVAMMA